MRPPIQSLPALVLLAAATASIAAPQWELVWSDDFSGPTVNASIWNVASNVSEGKPPTWNQIELYTAPNVFTRDGHLILRTRRENVTFDGVSYNITSGRVDSSFLRNVSFAAPGRVEVSARLQNDAASGIHTAHWLLGYGCWPNASEVDIMECQSPRNVYLEDGAGGAPWQVATSNYHIGPKCGVETKHTSGVSEYPRTAIAGNFSRDFTTFAVEFNATHLLYFVNDTQVNTVYVNQPGWSAPPIIPSWDMYVILSQAYMAKRPEGDMPEWVWDAGVEQAIDFVRVYSAV